MIEEIEAMIRTVKELRAHNRGQGTREGGRGIEAAACAIRQKALEDALSVVRRHLSG